MSASLQIKRIQKELQSLIEQPPENFVAQSVHANLFEWHFTIRGPESSDYEEGIYHGKIELPADYPIKPPNIFFLTPNGRFEIKTKICLNITKYHPENWNPSWTIRTMMEGIIQHFHVKDFAVGSIQYSSAQIQSIAKQSHQWACTECGAIIQLLKPREKAIPLPVEKQEEQNKNINNKEEKEEMEEIKEIKQIKVLNLQTPQQRDQIPEWIQNHFNQVNVNNQEQQQQFQSLLQQHRQQSLQYQGLYQQQQQQFQEQEQQEQFQEQEQYEQQEEQEQEPQQQQLQQQQQQPQQQQLFHFSNDILTPQQMHIFNKIQRFVEEETQAAGTIKFITPEVKEEIKNQQSEQDNEDNIAQIKNSGKLILINLALLAIVILFITINFGESITKLCNNFLHPQVV